MTKSITFNIGDTEIQSDDYFAIIEPVFRSVSIYDGPERYEEDLAKFSAEQRLVLAYHWYLSEVMNGGHDQFYDNSTGIVWSDALKAFREIGHTEVAGIINESVTRFGAAPSLDKRERQEQLELTQPDFEDLDHQLGKLIERADFDDKVLRFIRTHRESFLFSGVVRLLESGGT